MIGVITNNFGYLLYFFTEKLMVCIKCEKCIDFNSQCMISWCKIKLNDETSINSLYQKN